MRIINWILLTLGDAVQWIWHVGLAYLVAGLVIVSHLLNPLLAPILAFLNKPANVVAGWLTPLVATLPGWLSNTIISAVTGVFLLVVYKYTSNQTAIGRIKDSVKADLLAMKLYKDELSVVFRSQARVIYGALKLLRYSLFPLAVMAIPVCMLLAQMARWYQWRPLEVDEHTLVTMQLADTNDAVFPDVNFAPPEGISITVGPIRIPTRSEVCWQLKAREAGRYTLAFDIDGKKYTKELLVGGDYHQVCPLRPEWSWTRILLYPGEPPLKKNDPVRSITLEYPDRPSWAGGADGWLIYFFLASMLFALLFKPLIKVRI